MKTWFVKLLVTDCHRLTKPHGGTGAMVCSVECARRREIPCQTRVIFDGIEAENRADAVQAAELLAMMDRPWMERGKDIFDVHAFPSPDDPP